MASQASAKKKPNQLTTTLVDLITTRPGSNDNALTFDQVEAEVAAFEAQERERLGLAPRDVKHFRDENPQQFTRAQRDHTTLLLGGLTHAQDVLVAAALGGLGYNLEPLPVPDEASLRFGKEFGNRGQCNPTYFTVGNLIKTLTALRDEQGLTTAEIIDKYVFLTAGACGPCRFGTYATEYRKALRDAGFTGFRVLLFQQQGGLKQATGEETGQGLELTPKFFTAMLKALIAGDVLNAIGYRIRPYELEAGATDRALTTCKKILADALRERRSVLRALYRCRRALRRVAVNWSQPKPKVSIIGEFWAMTTEGDGNYRMQNFLESEGAEVDIQVITSWLLYNIWQHRWDMLRRRDLKQPDAAAAGQARRKTRKKLLALAVADRALRVVFQTYAKVIGLRHYHLPDMNEIATISHQHYDNHLRGGEGHMEVGKLIQSVEKRKAHMVISVKPFGCMPSSGVSDGVQSLVTAKYPDAIFCAIETTGDGAVNAHSRMQMDLFRARQVAVTEYDKALAERQLDAGLLAGWARRKSAIDYPRHFMAGTAANWASACGLRAR